MLTLESAGLNGHGDLLPKNYKNKKDTLALCDKKGFDFVVQCRTFHFLFGERRAVGLPVRADVGHGVLSFGYSQQGGAIVDQWLPALLPEVNNVLCGVLLQVREPAQTRRDVQKGQVYLKKNLFVTLRAARTLFSCLV